jgi:glycerophosphoryl diester phosphodiesterase
LGSIIDYTLTRGDAAGNEEVSLVAERLFSQDVGSAIVAHRGASSTQPENTLPAFEAAIAAGADALEFDVRLCADGVAVVCHDADLGRLAGDPRLIRDLRLDELERVAIHAEAGGNRIPTLEEVLALAAGRVAVDIEIKNLPGEPDFDPDEILVAAVTSELERVAFPDLVVITSFSPFSLARVRELAPGISTGLIADPGVDAGVALDFAREQGSAWVLPFVERVLEKGEDWFADVREAGMRVGTWVVDDPEVAVRLMRAGVDAIVTNDPATIVHARAQAFG